MNRSGFALLAALWVLTVTSVAVLAILLGARESVAASTNRVALARARWTAEGCTEATRARADGLLRAGTSWEDLGRYLDADQHIPQCRMLVRPTGFAVEANRATDERLVRLFLSRGWSPQAAQAAAAAIEDWRDADEDQRPNGAERPSYDAALAVGPRDGPFRADLELRLVHGLDTIRGLDSLLGTEPGRTPVNLAPLAVVASLPGVTAEVVERLRRRRLAGDPLRQLGELAEGVSRPARDSILARFGELVAEATIAPEYWIVAATAVSGSPALGATVELKLAPASSRAAIVRRRTW